MKVIHLSTRIVTEFGILDDAGNVTERRPVVTENGQALEVRVFSKEAFGEAFEQIAGVREKLVASLVLPAAAEAADEGK